MYSYREINSYGQPQPYSSYAPAPHSVPPDFTRNHQEYRQPSPAVRPHPTSWDHPSSRLSADTQMPRTYMAEWECVERLRSLEYSPSRFCEDRCSGPHGFHPHLPPPVHPHAPSPNNQSNQQQPLLRFQQPSGYHYPLPDQGYATPEWCYSSSPPTPSQPQLQQSPWTSGLPDPPPAIPFSNPFSPPHQEPQRMKPYPSPPSVSMDAIISMMHRLEARLEAYEHRWSMAQPPPWAEPDPSYGMPSSWQSPPTPPQPHVSDHVQQIWQQNDLQAQPLLPFLGRQVGNFEKNLPAIENQFNLDRDNGKVETLREKVGGVTEHFDDKSGSEDLGDDVDNDGEEDEVAGDSYTLILPPEKSPKSLFVHPSYFSVATEADLRIVCSEVGDVTVVRIMVNYHAMKNKGFAFLRFATVVRARRACANLKNPLVCGKQCVFDPGGTILPRVSRCVTSPRCAWIVATWYPP